MGESERTAREPERIRREASGPIKEDHLLDDGGGGERVVDLLHQDERLLYLFAHHNKGIRIETPAGETKTPYNSAAEGKRFFLITDERVLFIGQRDGDPDTAEYPHSVVNAAEYNAGFTKERITITLDDGTDVSFWNTSAAYTDVVGDAVTTTIEKAAAGSLGSDTDEQSHESEEGDNAGPDFIDVRRNAMVAVEEDHLLDDSGYGPRVLALLDQDERLLYLFANADTGVQFETPDGKTKTPYDTGSEANRYFLITDARMLFVGQKSGQPDVEEFSYANVGSVETNVGYTKQRFTVRRRDGSEVSFWNTSPAYADIDWDLVPDVVEDRFGFCPACGAQRPRAADSCADCGADLASRACAACDRVQAGEETHCRHCGTAV